MSTHIVENQNSIDFIEPINLVSVITTMLFNAGHPNTTAWQQTLHPDAFTTTDPKIQRFLINRCWRPLIGVVQGEDTLNIRYCLVDQGEISDWLRLFETGVLPCIIKHSLPIKAL